MYFENPCVQKLLFYYALPNYVTTLQVKALIKKFGSSAGVNKRSQMESKFKLLLYVQQSNHVLGCVNCAALSIDQIFALISWDKDSTLMRWWSVGVNC